MPNSILPTKENVQNNMDISSALLYLYSSGNKSNKLVKQQKISYNNSALSAMKKSSK